MEARMSLICCNSNYAKLGNNLSLAIYFTMHFTSFINQTVYTLNLFYGSKLKFPLAVRFIVHPLARYYSCSYIIHTRRLEYAWLNKNYF